MPDGLPHQVGDVLCALYLPDHLKLLHLLANQGKTGLRLVCYILRCPPSTGFARGCYRNLAPFLEKTQLMEIQFQRVQQLRHFG